MKIGFEFRNRGIHVFFQIGIANDLAGIEIQSVMPAELPHSQEGLARLADALADACLVSRQQSEAVSHAQGAGDFIASFAKRFRTRH